MSYNISNDLPSLTLHTRGSSSSTYRYSIIGSVRYLNFSFSLSGVRYAFGSTSGTSRSAGGLTYTVKSYIVSTSDGTDVTTNIFNPWSDYYFPTALSPQIVDKLEKGLIHLVTYRIYEFFNADCDVVLGYVGDETTAKCAVHFSKEAIHRECNTATTGYTDLTVNLEQSAKKFTLNKGDNTIVTLTYKEQDGNPKMEVQFTLNTYGCLFNLAAAVKPGITSISSSLIDADIFAIRRPRTALFMTETTKTAQMGDIPLMVKSMNIGTYSEYKVLVREQCRNGEAVAPVEFIQSGAEDDWIYVMEIETGVYNTEDSIARVYVAISHAEEAGCYKFSRFDVKNGCVVVCSDTYKVDFSGNVAIVNEGDILIDFEKKRFYERDFSVAQLFIPVDGSFTITSEVDTNGKRYHGWYEFSTFFIFDDNMPTYTIGANVLSVYSLKDSYRGLTRSEKDVVLSNAVVSCSKAGYNYASESEKIDGHNFVFICAFELEDGYRVLINTVLTDSEYNAVYIYTGTDYGFELRNNGKVVIAANSSQTEVRLEIEGSPVWKYSLEGLSECRYASVMNFDVGCDTDNMTDCLLMFN